MLQPSYTITLGTQQWTNQALALDLNLGAAPHVDHLKVRFPSSAPVKAGLGDVASLTLNNGETSGDVFSGTIESLGRTTHDILVVADNAAGILSRFRPAVTYESVSAGTVVRNLCGDANVDVASVEDGVPFAFYVADNLRSAWDHIARVCYLSGSMARVNASNEVEARVVDATTADIALRYGRELLSIESSTYTRPIESFTVVGQSGAGDTGSPDARRPSVDFFGGKAPDPPSLGSRWRTEPALRTVSAAARAGAATQRLYKSGAQCGRLDAFLQPELKPGSILQIQDLPDGLPGGPLFVSSVRHRLQSGGGAVTHARFWQGGDAFDPLALLGSLLGAIGGLL